MLPNSAQSHAVLIGVSGYTHLPSFPTVHNNLDGLAEVLMAPWSWNLSPEHCTILRDPGESSDVVRVVESAADAATDTLLIYYAGHGLADASDDYALHLALTNSTSQVHTAFRYQYLSTLIRRSRARRKVVILDCCFAARAFSNAMSDVGTNLAAQSAVEGTFVLAAAGESKAAIADDGEGYTVFTGELLSLLRQGVDGGPELLQLETIYTQLYHRLRLKSRPLPQLSGRNTVSHLAMALNRHKAHLEEAARRRVEAEKKRAAEERKRAEKRAELAEQKRLLAQAKAREMAEKRKAEQTRLASMAEVAQNTDRMIADLVGQWEPPAPAPVQGSGVDQPTPRWRLWRKLREAQLEEKVAAENDWRIEFSDSASPEHAAERRRSAERLARRHPHLIGEASKILCGVISDPNVTGMERRWAAESLRDLGPQFQAFANRILRVMYSDPVRFSLTTQGAAELLNKLDSIEMFQRAEDFHAQGNSEEGELWYRKAAQVGHTEAMYKLGGLLDKRDDAAAAEQWYRKAADLGHADATGKVGQFVSIAGDDKEAEEWYRRAIAAGSTVGMNYLGDLYYSSRPQEAEYWYRKAADLGNQDAMINLRWFLADRGDFLQALYWGRRALTEEEIQSSPSIMFKFGQLAESGGDKQQAEEWFLKAANAGDADAMYRYGTLLMGRWDFRGAERWLRQSANSGTVDAMRYLADLLDRRGEQAEAAFWRTKAG
ncbi:caspase family protein [Actinacidiphila glaucinigra]|uniref:caspase, EACC1-associated type n=1 Tax=Actinacidiphila glaucinigra TaxID=235986 RepID=UPI00386F9688